MALSCLDRNLRGHGLGLGQLILASVGHEDGTGPDGGVKHLNQTLLAAGIEVGKGVKKGSPPVAPVNICLYLGQNSMVEEMAVIGRRSRNDGLGLEMGPVRIHEGPGEVYDFLPPPLQDESRLFRNDRHIGGFEVLLGRILHEELFVFGRHNNCHPLLGLGNSQLCPVQARILLWHLIEIYDQAVRQLADGNGNAARPEVIALLDDVGDFLPAEETLQLPLRRRIALLDLCPALGRGLGIVRLGGAGRSPDAVPAGPAAEEDDPVPGIRSQPLNRSSGRSPENGPDFHPLGRIVGVVEFLDIPGRQADLIPVRRISMGGLPAELLLGELALHGLRVRHRGVRSPGDPHGLIDIGPAGKRVPDGPAQAGGRPAEGLDFRRVVVGLVLEVQEPLLFDPVHFNRDDDGAGIDFVGFLLIIELALGLELLGCKEGDVHEADVFIVPVLIENLEIVLIFFERIFDRLLI